MKVKNITWVLWLVVFSVALCVFLFFFTVPTRVFASSGEIGILNQNTIITIGHTIDFPEDNKGTNQVLSIKNFEFNEDGKYKVEYSFLRTESKTAIFQPLKEAVEVSEENPTASLEYNFFENHGVGTYRIKAVILLNNQIVAMPQELKLTIQKPAISNLAWEPGIKQVAVGTSKGDFPEYAFYAEVQNDGHYLDLTNYDVKWYATFNNEETTFVGNGNSIKWSASEAGMYQMEFRIAELGIECSQNIGNMAKNYSHYAIYALIGLGIVITIIAVVTTISKVKKERVW